MVKESSAMGESVCGYTVKRFEMPPFHDEMPPFRVKEAALCVEMAPFQMLSPARDISFHP